MSENSEFVGQLVSTIINTGEIEQDGWEEFSLVIVFEDDRVSETFGYSYDAEGEWAAISVRPRLIREEAIAYREWLKQNDDKAIIKMLVQFNRVKRDFNIDFEYEDTMRWNVTPANIDKITQELRPNLGD